jgi:hypothetical protein
LRHWSAQATANTGRASTIHDGLAAFLGTIIALYVADGWVGERLLYVTAGGFHLSGSCYYIARSVGGRQTLVTLSTRTTGSIYLGHWFLYLVYLLEEHDEKNGTHESNHGHGHSHRHEEHNHEHSEL